MASELRFTERQTTAILEMRLQKLIGLEIEALMKDHEDTLKHIAEYEDILENRATMAKVLIKELQSYKKQYAVPRKTLIDNLEEAVVEEKRIEEMDVVFSWIALAMQKRWMSVSMREIKRQRIRKTVTS